MASSGEYRRRNSLRYPGYDYSQPGLVFVTICTFRSQRLFGAVEHGRMIHSRAGEAVQQRWRAIPERFPSVDIDAFVVMPDHVHGILMCGIDPHSPSATVGDVIRWFKSSVVDRYRGGVLHEGWDSYDRHLWHRDYHDRIIRNEEALESCRGYIEGNPDRWWNSRGNS